MAFRPVLLLLVYFLAACSGSKQTAGPASATQAPFFWESANVYFLLTDRFYNGDPDNDVQFNRTKPSAKLRGFMGGDIRGITKKLEEGYFSALGINAIWFTPVLEQVHGQVDEGTGATYGYHGYWTKDWTRLDPAFGTEADLANMVRTAHERGIRVLMDVVVNHTGPVTGDDPVWPAEWVRLGPQCSYKDYRSTITCTLVRNLPDIKTESNEEVGLPQQLINKWKFEGRYEQEIAELEAFFVRTGYPRAPRFYIYKWLTDYVREYGIDGYRCDTAKHTEESVWAELRKEAEIAFDEWKKAHPAEVLDDNDFFMTAEVYGYNIASGRMYDFGNVQVDFFGQGFNSLINFGFKSDAAQAYEALFSQYSNLLQGPLQGKTVMNYISSHDDGGPFDKDRKMALEAGTRLLLCPGQAQVYYGDESARQLVVPGAQGDAHLRSFMNWEEIAGTASRTDVQVPDVLAHWQKLGRFRRDHPAVGAGEHHKIADNPYVFRRRFTRGAYTDAVVVGLALPEGKKSIPVDGAFPDGAVLRDYYSGKTATVRRGKAVLSSPYGIVLLGK